jgi:hypothetical protein
MTLPAGALGSIVVNETISLSGGEGTQIANEVLWSHYALTQWSAAGTWTCVGAQLCGLLGIPDGTALPIATLNQLTGVVNYAPMYLGTWVLDPTLSTLTLTDRAFSQINGPTVAPPLIPGRPAQWLTFGTQELCCLQDPNGPSFPFPLPQPPYPNDIPDPAEPGAGALGLLAVAGLGYVARARRVA